jgi:DNA replication and repair protein RecF
VHLAHLRLRDFRNYARLDVDFAPGFHLLLGDNAQGKTNILEAIYLMATLRSFRGVGGAQMIRHEAKGYFVGGNVVGGLMPAFSSLSSQKGGEGRGAEANLDQTQNPSPPPSPGFGATSQPSPRLGGEREKKILTSQSSREIKIYWSARERKLTLDGQPVRRLSDFLGTLRAVVFCTEDLQLVKGTARTRRRFLDLLLTQTHPTYLPLLQRYTQALRSRNALLKQPAPDEAALDSFSAELVKLGNELIRLRRELAPKLSPLARLAYRRISNDAEELRVEYLPAVKNDFAVELAQARKRERTFRATLIGPHRDDLQLLLNNKSAAQFGSEGQQRTLAIALKMAQAEYLTGIHGSPPILLIDDIMGELDVKRRSGFLPLLERAHETSGQVFMTCTEENWPRELGRDLQRWEVVRGTLVATK